MEPPRALSIRPSTAADHPAIEALLRDAPLAAQSTIAAPELVAECGGVLIGLLAYRVIHDEGEILNLAVHPHWRRQRVAHSLLAHVLPLAPVWFLEVRASNQPALALYRQLGFHQAGRRPQYYSDGEDALLLRLGLR